MWLFVFWFSIGVIAYSYVGYPLILFLLDRLNRRPAHRFDDADFPSICLVISAFNEEKVIRKKIENSLDLEYPKDKYTLLLASDGSDDDTVKIAEEYRRDGLQIFHRPERSGKSSVLNDVLAKIDAEIVVFTDANSLFAPDAILKLVRHFSDPDIGCVVGKLRYVNRHTSSVGKGEGLYWKYEGMLSVLESALRSVLVANGSIFGIRRSLVARLYPEVANDFQLPFEIASQGYGVIYEPDALALERSPIYWQEEFERKVRIVLRGLTGFTRMRSKIRGFRLWQFCSHKLFRWAVGPFLFFALLANIMLMEGSVFYTTLFGLQVAFYLAALNGWRVRRTRKPHFVFYLPFYFTMVNLAAVIATAKYLSGERKVVWEKAESARFAPVSPSAEAFLSGAKLRKAPILDDDHIVERPRERVAKN